MPKALKPLIDAALDMSRQARMKRAQDMGFDKKGFHGTVTGADIEDFDRRSRYGNRRVETYFAPDSDRGRSFASSFAEGEQGRVMPVRLRTQGFLDTRRPEDRAAFERILAETGLDRDFRYAPNVRGEPDLPGWGNQNVIDAVNEAGYDGLVLQERPDFESYAAFNPAAVRSEFAAFDPAKRDSSNLLAGVGGAAVGAGLLAAPDEAEAGFSSAGAKELVRRGREAFLGAPRITRASNASDLRPRAVAETMEAEPEPFLGDLTVRHGPGRSVVFDGDDVVASYDQYNTLVVSPKYRRKGVGTELVAQRRTMFPDQPPATERTRNAQRTQEAAWERIQRGAGGFARPGMMAAAGAGGAAAEFARRRQGKPAPYKDMARFLLETGEHDSITALPDNWMVRAGEYLTEDRPSEMGYVQRALQRTEQLQSLGEWLRKTGQGDRTQVIENAAAGLDISPI